MVTDVTRSNEFKSSRVVHYGNEADGIGCMYYYVSLMVDIGPKGDRRYVRKGTDEQIWRMREYNESVSEYSSDEEALSDEEAMEEDGAEDAAPTATERSEPTTSGPTLIVLRLSTRGSKVVKM